MTLTGEGPTQVSFHDSTLSGVSQHGSTVELSIDDAFVDQMQRPARVVVEGVSEIRRYEIPVDVLRMEKADGEILSLSLERDRVLLVVQWNDFAAKTRETIVYGLVGPALSLRIEVPAEAS